MLGLGRSGVTTSVTTCVTVPPATATRGRALRSLCLFSLSLLCLELGRLATSRRGGCVTERPPRPRKFTIRSHHDAMGRAPCHSWRVALGQPGGAGRKAPRAVMWTIVASVLDFRYRYKYEYVQKLCCRARLPSQRLSA